MQCVICSVEFEAKRADAKFCSSTCRSKGSRLEFTPSKETTDMEEALVIEPVVENMTPDGQVRKVWDKKVENLKGGYLHIGQTQEEYIDNIPEVGYLFDGTKCTHPLKEQLYARCLCCNELVPMIRRERKPIIDEKKK